MIIDYAYLSFEILLIAYPLYFTWSLTKKKPLKKHLLLTPIFLLVGFFVTSPIAVMCGCDFNSDFNGCSQACAPRERTLQVTKFYEYVINDNLILNYGE